MPPRGDTPLSGRCLIGSYWLYDLPDVLEAAGLDFDLWPGWETRARNSGGYDNVWAVFVHHTASDGPQDDDCAYEWDATGGDQPIGALNLGRDGHIYIGAAGATNCQGKGGPWKVSKGTIPQDKGNAYGIAIEAGNSGTGEAWPQAQTDAYVKLVAALCDAYGLDPARDVLSHWEWVEPAPTTGRKIDPAGPSPYAGGTASWDMDAFRDDVVHCDGNEPPPPPEEDEVTDEDIQRIATAVWRYMTVDQTVNKPVTAEQLLQYTRNAAANADKQTKP